MDWSTVGVLPPGLFVVVGLDGVYESQRLDETGEQHWHHHPLQALNEELAPFRPFFAVSVLRSSSPSNVETFSLRGVIVAVVANVPSTLSALVGSEHI